MQTLRVLALIVTALSAVSLGSCNTTRGFGQDLQMLGSKVSSSADRNNTAPAY